MNPVSTANAASTVNAANAVDGMSGVATAAAGAVSRAGAGAPAPCPVPDFAPIRAGGGGHRLRRVLRRRRRMVAAGLAMTAAAVAAAAPREAPRPAWSGRAGPAPAAVAAARDTVRAPVRIADAQAVRLVRPGDRVDVMAAARIVARAAPVVAVPRASDGFSAGLGPDTADGVSGALIVLSVPRATAAELSGAAAGAPLSLALR
ncbi:hypothetical protein ACFYXS_38285 [Streptomyces sp. NPDC002574]|uniref:hypothetical protein n=1 Tax=Streptomyces sp. NPDC002574 TaxID=3364652 RepID=UPI0036AB804D